MQNVSFSSHQNFGPVTLPMPERVEPDSPLHTFVQLIQL